MQKYSFSIKTRDGLLIKRLIIAGRDQEDAERKLKQMYRHCEIVGYESHRQETKKSGQQDIIEDIASLLKQQSISA